MSQRRTRSSRQQQQQQQQQPQFNMSVAAVDVHDEFAITLYSTSRELMGFVQDSFVRIQNQQNGFPITGTHIAKQHASYNDIYNNQEIVIDAAVVYGNSFGMLDDRARSTSIHQILAPDKFATRNEFLNLQRTINEMMLNEYNGEAPANKTLLVNSHMEYPAMLLYTVCEHEPLSNRMFNATTLYNAVRSVIQTVRQYNRLKDAQNSDELIGHIAFALDPFIEPMGGNLCAIADQVALGCVQMSPSYAPRYPLHPNYVSAHAKRLANTLLSVNERVEYRNDQRQQPQYSQQQNQQYNNNVQSLSDQYALQQQQAPAPPQQSYDLGNQQQQQQSYQQVQVQPYQQQQQVEVNPSLQYQQGNAGVQQPQVQQQQQQQPQQNQYYQSRVIQQQLSQQQPQLTNNSNQQYEEVAIQAPALQPMQFAPPQQVTSHIVQTPQHTVQYTSQNFVQSAPPPPVKQQQNNALPDFSKILAQPGVQQFLQQMTQGAAQGTAQAPQTTASPATTTPIQQQQPVQSNQGQFAFAIGGNSTEESNRQQLEQQRQQYYQQQQQLVLPPQPPVLHMDTVDPSQLFGASQQPQQQTQTQPQQQQQQPQAPTPTVVTTQLPIKKWV